MSVSGGSPLSTVPTTCEACGERTTRKVYGSFCGRRCLRRHQREQREEAERRAREQDRPQCGHRDCLALIPPRAPGARGPRKTYCTPACQRAERYAREVEQGIVGPKPKAEHKPRGRARYQPGHQFDGTALTLVRRAPEYGASMAWLRCTCGAGKVARLGNVQQQRTCTCGRCGRSESSEDRARHT